MPETTKNKGGRPRGGRDGGNVHIRMSEAELARVDKARARTGESRGGLMRRLSLEKLAELESNQ